MNQKELIDQINWNTKELTELLASLDQSQLNTIPFEGSWTGGQLVSHVIKFSKGFLGIFKGAKKDTKRNPDELVERIVNDFLDFKIKMVSPEFVAPEKIDYKKEDLSAELKFVNQGLKEAVQTLDLSKTYMAFEMPVYGFLTGIEAISFVISHTQRHIEQLKNIVNKLKEFENV